MKMPHLFACSIIFFILATSCNNLGYNVSNKKKSAFKQGTYYYDADFLKKFNLHVYELKDGISKVLVSADYQGRVMTSTANGDSGFSFGWLNYDLISAKKKKQQFNPFGGEERLWLGPEGGQYSLYFQGGDSFDINYWQVPAFIDKDAFMVTSASDKSISFTKQAEFKNYSGYTFNVTINRTVTIVNKDETAHLLNITIPSGVNSVAFKTDNIVINNSNNNWKKDSGLLSVWLLGMFTPSPKTKVIIPFKYFSNPHQYITDNYFGNIPAERLKIKDSVIYFTCDGKYRSKIGISPAIAKPLAASYDFQKNVLTVLVPQVSATAPYVNSKWELQKEPYKGDVINSYNDGPLADGTQMGPFYEIESSSPALQLKKHDKASYSQVTCHLQGSYTDLNKLSQQILHVNLDDVK